MEEESKKGVILMMCQTNEDLIAFANSIRKNEAGIKMFTGDPSKLTSRQKDSVKVDAGDSLFLVAHGNESSWGSDNDYVEIDPEDVLQFVISYYSNINVYLCICNSWEYGQKLRKEGTNLRVWAADGTPKLEWNQDKKQIKDETGVFKEVS